MPRLLFFLPCERVIVSREGPLSLITVIEGFTVKFPEEEYAKLPNDAVLPLNWHVVIKWIREANEEPQIWEQRIEVVAPDGRIPTSTVSAFDLVANSAMRSIVEVEGMAIKPLGPFNITLSLRKEGEDDAAWREIVSYPFYVQNVPPHQPESDSRF